MHSDIGEAAKRYNESGLDGVSDEADAWMLALALGAEKDGLMEALMKRFPSLAQFAERYGLAASDPEVVERYERELRSWRETESWREYCEREGHEKGLAEGFARSVSNLMAAQGLGVDQAMGILAVPEDIRGIVETLVKAES